ncbi:SRPBCC family protein [Kribbella swartbergensis]
MTTSTGPDGLPELRVTRSVACTPAELWKAVTQPDVLSDWLGTTRPTTDHFGQYEVMSGPLAGVTGMVVACEPPHFFHITLNEHVGGKLAVEVVETSHGCELVLTHRGVSTSRAADERSRWTTLLERLATHVERRRTDTDLPTP